MFNFWKRQFHINIQNHENAINKKIVIKILITIFVRIIYFN